MLFTDRHEAALALGRRLDHLRLDEPVVAGLEPDGIPIARDVAAVLDAPVVPLAVTPDRRLLPLFDGRTVVVVGESLTPVATARSACRVARGAGATSIVLAVPAASFVFAELAACDADAVVVVELRPWFRSIDEVYGAAPAGPDRSSDPAAFAATGR